jgi:hypothetical protein
LTLQEIRDIPVVKGTPLKSYWNITYRINSISSYFSGSST